MLAKLTIFLKTIYISKVKRSKFLLTISLLPSQLSVCNCLWKNYEYAAKQGTWKTILFIKSRY